MTGEWSRIRELFEAAVDLPPEERAAFLIESCTGAPELRAQVEELLGADDAQTGELSIEQPLPADLASDIVEQELSGAIAGQTIGGYRIERVLGSGGMSTVFLAVQESPHREVALKTMRAGMFSPVARRRFEFESEVLGQLRHPGIAQVFEAGTWQEPLAGQEVPFFALEYVQDAVPLDQHIRESAMDLRAGLELFCQVCDAVSYGHGLGVIHRDLKPANVLVDASGRPKIIDFGIARATGSDVQGLTVQTQTGHVMGTLRYMAPEQLDGVSDIDTRVDVYALGVMLYEILAGVPILDPGTMSLTAFARKVREIEPPVPSRSDRGFAAVGIPRDLDWVTRKAIASERSERYSSVQDLAGDLRRFVANQPVSVGPPTAGYQLRKFIRRNRAVVLGVSAAFVILVAGIIATTWQMFRAEESAELARREVVKAKTINDFYNDLLKFADPAEGRYRSRHDWTVRDALDAAAELFPRLAHEPEAEAQARLSIGNAYKSLGQLEKAEANLVRAVELRRQELGADHPDVADAELSLGVALVAGQKYDAALERFLLALRTFERELGPDDPQVALAVLNVGTCYYRKGELDRAETEIKRAIAIYRRLDPPQPRFLALALPFLGNIAEQRKQIPVALSFWREALSMFEIAGKEWHPNAAFVHRALARQLPRLPAENAEAKTKNFELAERHLKSALEISQAAWGVESRHVRDTLHRLAQHYYTRRSFDSAYAIRSRLIGAEKKLFGAEAREVGVAHLHVATIQQERGEHEDAEQHYRKAIAILDRTSGKQPWDPIAIRARLSGILRARGKHDAALEIAEGGYRRGVELGGEQHPQIRTIAVELAKCLREQKRYGEAAKILRQRIAIEEKSGASVHLLLARVNLAIVLGRSRESAEARDVFEGLLAADWREYPAWARAAVLRAHGVFLGSVGEHEAGAKQLREAIRIFDASIGPAHSNSVLSRKNLADLLDDHGKPDAAKKIRDQLRR